MAGMSNNVKLAIGVVIIIVLLWIISRRGGNPLRPKSELDELIEKINYTQEKALASRQ